LARRYANLMLIPEDGGRVRQTRVRMWPAATWFAAGLLVVGLAAGGVAATLALVSARHAAAAVAMENEALRGQLVQMGGEIERLDGTVRQHIHLANQSRLLAGLPPIGEEAALLGVGGSPLSAAGSAQGGLSPALAQTVEVFDGRLGQLARQLDFQGRSFVEVKQLIEANREKLDHIPTINPVLGSFYISSGFGQRRDPFTGEPGFHTGLDICAQRGTPFCSAADGKVVYASTNGSFGKTIKIDHGNGFETIYAHAHRILVEKGQSVRRGDVIGEVGSSGRSTGDHLHYEVRQNGRPVNPRRYLLSTSNLAS
jgi:murein DD-endopeptidase MepM/ murein hydrolase activator NlpD